MSEGASRESLAAAPIWAVKQKRGGSFATPYFADFGYEVLKIGDPRVCGDGDKNVPSGSQSKDSALKSDAVYSNISCDVPFKFRWSSGQNQPDLMVGCRSLTGFCISGPWSTDPRNDFILRGLRCLCIRLIFRPGHSSVFKKWRCSQGLTIEDMGTDEIVISSSFFWAEIEKRGSLSHKIRGKLPFEEMRNE